mmetsp:Transcript_55827/g.99404  ORF Transcript_55827/g.99404 Transcript_55827/m.99404 type:complete len:83 (-) Transcript_55827:688-936(-)
MCTDEQTAKENEAVAGIAQCLLNLRNDVAHLMDRKPVNVQWGLITVVLYTYKSPAWVQMQGAVWGHPVEPWPVIACRVLQAL